MNLITHFFHLLIFLQMFAGQQITESSISAPLPIEEKVAALARLSKEIYVGEFAFEDFCEELAEKNDLQRGFLNLSNNKRLVFQVREVVKSSSDVKEDTVVTVSVPLGVIKCEAINGTLFEYSKKLFPSKADYISGLDKIVQQRNISGNNELEEEELVNERLRLYAIMMENISNQEIAAKERWHSISSGKRYLIFISQYKVGGQYRLGNAKIFDYKYMSIVHEEIGSPAK